MYQATGEIRSLYRGIVKPGFRSIHFTVLNIGRAEKCQSLYREYRFTEDRYIGVPLYMLYFSNSVVYIKRSVGNFPRMTA